MVCSGVVRSWSEDDGWGVVDGPDVPGGCWAHVSTVAGDRRSLRVSACTWSWETPGQDGYDYRAVRVWSEGSKPARRRPRAASSTYHSTLTLTFDEPGTTVGLDLSHLVGQDYGAALTRLVELRLQVRVLGPDEPVTLEHVDDRVTLVVEEGTVVGAQAG